MAVYTGKETKIQMNMSDTPNKVTPETRDSPLSYTLSHKLAVGGLGSGVEATLPPNSMSDTPNKVLDPNTRNPLLRERKFFIDNLLFRVPFIIEMIRWTGFAP